MSEIIRTIWTGLIGASPLDQLNLVLGVAGVWLMIKRSLWAFPVGLVSVAVQGILFFNTKFYADATLQLFFFWTLAWGWWHWVKDRGDAPELPVTVLPWASRALVLVGALGGTLFWAWVLRKWTDAIMPFRDAFIAAFSVAAQFLQARKNLENWAVWVIVNLVAIISYFRAELAFTAFLYAIYLIMAVLGWRDWHRASLATLRRAGA